MLVYQMIVSGLNGELFDAALRWSAWAGDAATAFLQGRQSDLERPLPLYMRGPKDGLISKTSRWSHDLYQILGNVYGLSNAPHLWTSTRLKSICYERHGFDPQLFVHRDPHTGSPTSMLLVYVDDMGLFRSDYDIAQVQTGRLEVFESRRAHNVQGETDPHPEDH